MEENKTLEMENNEVTTTENFDLECPSTEVSGVGTGKVALVAGGVVLIGTALVLGYKKGKKWLDNRKAKKEADEDTIDLEEEDIVEEEEEESKNK